MNGERLEEVIKIMTRYNNSSQSIIDYYDLFEFNRNATLEDIKLQIKKMKLQVLFHPDQIKFIPVEYTVKYLEMIELVKGVINTFSTEENRRVYDMNLVRCLNFGNDRGTDNHSNGSDGQTVDLDDIRLQQAIIINSNKYSFDFTMKSLQDIIQSNFFGGFTRNDSARDVVANIGRQKIVELVTKSSMNANNINLEQVIMNYFTQIMYTNPVLKQQIDCVEQACVNTLKKYDLNGIFGQTAHALNNYVSIGNAIGFTNNNNARVNLMNNVDPKNVPFIIKCTLNKDDYPYYNIKNMGNDELNTIYVNNLYRKIRTNSYDGSGYGSGNAGFNR